MKFIPAAFSIILLMVAFDAGAQTPPSITGNCNAYGDNNSLCNNYGPVSRHMNQPGAEKMKSQMLSEFSRTKSYKVVALLDDPEAFQFAGEILEFLKEQGFDATGVDQAMWTPPVSGLAKRVLPNGDIEIQVGTNR